MTTYLRSYAKSSRVENSEQSLLLDQKRQGSSAVDADCGKLPKTTLEVFCSHTFLRILLMYSFCVINSRDMMAIDVSLDSTFA